MTLAPYPNPIPITTLCGMDCCCDTEIMGFWHEVAAGFLGNVLAGFLLVLLYVFIQWFLRVTDVTIGYSWRFDGTMQEPYNLRPSFDIRNMSNSRTYVLSNIAYLREGKPVAAFDNTSVWGTELRPGSIAYVEAVPIPTFTSLEECKMTEVHVRLQGRRLFWLRGQGPGQLYKGIQRAAFTLRDRLERMAFPME